MANSQHRDFPSRHPIDDPIAPNSDLPDLWFPNPDPKLRMNRKANKVAANEKFVFRAPGAQQLIREVFCDH